MQLLRRAVALCICAAICVPVHAEPATARYAPAQLRFAEEELARARQAEARGDLLLAERLATQASLDARLAWSMTESAVLRREAAQVHRRAAAIMRAIRLDSSGEGEDGRPLARIVQGHSMEERSQGLGEAREPPLKRRHAGAVAAGTSSR